MTIAVALLLLPHAALASDDCGELGTDILTKEWFGTAAECATGKLLDEGKGVLGDLAMSLAGKAVDAALPGVGSLLSGLVGGGGDPFAQHAERILHQIGESEQRIIASLNQNANQEDLEVNFPSLMALGDRYWLNPFHERVDMLNDLRGLDAGWEPLVRSLQLPRHGPRSLHAYVAAVSAHLDVLAERQLVEATRAEFGPPYKPALEAASGEVLREIESITREMTLGHWANVLNGGSQSGVFDYIADLADGQLRRYSDQRFGEREDGFGNVRACPDLEDGAYLDGMTSRYDFPRVPDPVQYGLPEDVDQQPSTFTIRWEVVSSGCGDEPWRGWASLWDENGSEVGIRAFGSAGEAMDAVWEQHRDEQYESFLVEGYGVVRPTLDAWWRTVNSGPPPSWAADDVLDDAILNRGAYHALYMLGAVAGWDSLSAAEIRLLANYGLAHGFESWSELRRTADSADPWAAANHAHSRGAFLEVLRTLTSPSNAKPTFEGNFAAKVMSVL